MEEITIYRTDWNRILGGILCLLCCGVCVFALFHGKAGELGWWISLLLCGFGGVITLDTARREFRKPYLVITEKRLFISRIPQKDWIINFTEVERFERVPFSVFSPFTKQLSVYYKVEKKVFSPTIRGRIASKIFSLPHEYIPIDGVKMKAQQLCDLLNEKVAESLKN